MNLYKKFPILPFKTGKEGRSLAMIMPSTVLKSIRFDPKSMYFILKVNGINSLQLDVIRDKDQGLNKEGNLISAQEFTRLPEQTSIVE